MTGDVVVVVIGINGAVLRQPKNLHAIGAGRVPMSSPVYMYTDQLELAGGSG